VNEGERRQFLKRAWAHTHSHTDAHSW